MTQEEQRARWREEKRRQYAKLTLADRIVRAAKSNERRSMESPEKKAHRSAMQKAYYYRRKEARQCS